MIRDLTLKKINRKLLFNEYKQKLVIYLLESLGFGI